VWDLSDWVATTNGFASIRFFVPSISWCEPLIQKRKMKKTASASPFEPYKKTM
jgi:hypothetical protein